MVKDLEFEQWGYRIKDLSFLIETVREESKLFLFYSLRNFI